MFGKGRPRKSPSIDSVRELAPAELENLIRGKGSSVKKFRDSHHRLARLFASGLRPGEVAELGGYSLVRVSTLYGDPAFKELIASYRNSVDVSWRESVDEYYEVINSNRTLAARLINDKLSEAEPEDLPLNQLVAIHADAADRTGYPKRTVAVNVNTDFASLLDRAIKRSGQVAKPPELKVIEGSKPAPLEAGQMGAVGTSQHLHAAPALVRRRI